MYDHLMTHASETWMHPVPVNVCAFANATRSHQGQSTAPQDSGSEGLSCHLMLNMIHLDVDKLQLLLRNLVNASALWLMSSKYTN